MSTHGQVVMVAVLAGSPQRTTIETYLQQLNASTAQAVDPQAVATPTREVPLDRSVATAQAEQAPGGATAPMPVDAADPAQAAAQALWHMSQGEAREREAQVVEQERAHKRHRQRHGRALVGPRATRRRPTRDNSGLRGGSHAQSHSEPPAQPVGKRRRLPEAGRERRTLRGGW